MCSVPATRRSTALFIRRRRAKVVPHCIPICIYSVEELCLRTRALETTRLLESSAPRAVRTRKARNTHKGPYVFACVPPRRLRSSHRRLSSRKIDAARCTSGSASRPSRRPTPASRHPVPCCGPPDQTKAPRGSETRTTSPPPFRPRLRPPLLFQAAVVLARKTEVRWPGLRFSADGVGCFDP